MKNSIKIVLVAVMALVLQVGCSGAVKGFKVADQPSGDYDPLGGDPVLKKSRIELQFKEGLNLIYDTAHPLDRAAEFETNTSFTVVINQLADSADSTFKYSIDGGALQDIAGSTFTLSFSQQKDYELNVFAVPKDGAPEGRTDTKRVFLRIVCSTPETFSAANATINVSPNGSNAYGYSLSTTATFTHKCAWDFNGDGIVDTAFGPCQREGVSNHVQNRNISVVVKSTTCNNEFTITKAVAVQEPAPGLEYIFGTISPLDSSNLDPRTNVRHFSTTPNPDLVSCGYDQGNGQWTVVGQHKYNLDYSEFHGLAVTSRMTPAPIAGGGTEALPGYDDLLNTTRTFNQGTFSALSFFTDKQLDESTALRFDAGAGRGSCRVTRFKMTSKPIETTVPCTFGPRKDLMKRQLILYVDGDFECDSILPSGGINYPGNLQLRMGGFKCETFNTESCEPPVQGGTPETQF